MNKMTMFVGLLVAIMSVSASGVGFIGTPTAELDQGQWSVGFNYMYSDMELDKTKMSESMNGVLIDTYKKEIDDVKTQRYYGTIGYGVTDSWEAYVQLGIADVKAKDRDDDPGEDWDGTNFDNDFAWGWGTRYTFHEQDNCRWGASLQMNWLDTIADDKGSGWEQDIDYETYDLLIAVGPTVDMGGWNLYGGPFYYFLSGDLDVTYTLGGTTYKHSGDLEADGIGVFVGAQFTLMEKCDLTTELSFTGDGYAIGAGVAVLF